MHDDEIVRANRTDSHETRLSIISSSIRLFEHGIVKQCSCEFEINTVDARISSAFVLVPLEL